MKAILGEIIIARYAKRMMDNKWQIEAPGAVVNDILRHGLYSHAEAEETIKKLVPIVCRPFIKFVL